jgi:hypothetical protein
MRLIDARKFVNGERDIFRDRNDSDYFSYAILSHRWEDEEVSFQDVRQLHASPFLKERKGYRKVLSACLRALADCFLYIWIDTCKCCIQCVGSTANDLLEGCIDRTSSAELQEAINSMLHWYEESTVCYVYGLPKRLAWRLPALD